MHKKRKKPNKKQEKPFQNFNRNAVSKPFQKLLSKN